MSVRIPAWFFSRCDQKGRKSSGWFHAAALLVVECFLNADDVCLVAELVDLFVLVALLVDVVCQEALRIPGGNFEDAMEGNASLLGGAALRGPWGGGVLVVLLLVGCRLLGRGELGGGACGCLVWLLWSSEEGRLCIFPA